MPARASRGQAGRGCTQALPAGIVPRWTAAQSWPAAGPCPPPAQNRAWMISCQSWTGESAGKPSCESPCVERPYRLTQQHCFLSLHLAHHSKLDGFGHDRQDGVQCPHQRERCHDTSGHKAAGQGGFGGDAEAQNLCGPGSKGGARVGMRQHASGIRPAPPRTTTVT